MHRHCFFVAIVVGHLAGVVIHLHFASIACCDIYIRVFFVLITFSAPNVANSAPKPTIPSFHGYRVIFVHMLHYFSVSLFPPVGIVPGIAAVGCGSPAVTLFGSIGFGIKDPTPLVRVLSPYRRSSGLIPRALWRDASLGEISGYFILFNIFVPLFGAVLDLAVLRLSLTLIS